MELDGPSKSHVFGGARTLKAIIKNKGVIGAKTGGTGVRRGTATVSLNPKKPNKPCRSVLQTKEVSPKEVPSRFKNIVKRMNKRKRKLRKVRDCQWSTLLMHVGFAQAS